MSDIIRELMLEILKDLQTGQKILKEDMRGLKSGQISIMNIIHNRLNLSDIE